MLAPASAPPSAYLRVRPSATQRAIPTRPVHRLCNPLEGAPPVECTACTAPQVQGPDGAAVWLAPLQQVLLSHTLAALMGLQ